MEIRFERGREIRRETRQLPSDLYNRLRILAARSGPGGLFVPIRPMQYLAVVDSEEVIFVDGQGPRRVEIAWREFRSRERTRLDEPVRYQCVYYEPKGLQAAPRLQGEFVKALRLFEQRQSHRGGAATVLPFD